MGQSEWSVTAGNPLLKGAQVLSDGINFSVEVKDNEKADLILIFSDKHKVTIPLPENPDYGDVRSVCVRDLKADNFGYYYRIAGKKTLDPYAVKIVKGLCYAGLADFDWRGDHAPELSVSDLQICKFHVKGFTKKVRSGVKNRGTFAGAAEKIDYLRDLGFNAVMLMPCYEYDDSLPVLPPYARAEPAGVSASEVIAPRNYWGYAEHNYYFAPRQSFSSSEDSISEVREMVRKFHEAGIEVLMEMYFPEKTNPTLASEAVRFWKTSYHIDGFHFIGQGIPVETLVRDPYLSRTKLFFEQLDVGWIYDGRPPKHKHLLEMNNRFLTTGRRYLKGDDGQLTAFAENERRNPSEIGVVNYMADTNGFTLSDSVCYEWKHNEENGEDNHDGTQENFTWNCGAEGRSRKKSINTLRSRQIRNALTYLFLAEGVPLILAGDERMNTQDGNNNAYSADNAVGWVDWGRTKADLLLLDFFRSLSAFRKEHPVLHLKHRIRGFDYLNFGYPDISYHGTRAWISDFRTSSRTMGVLYCGLYAEQETGKKDDFIFAAFNPYWEAQEFALPLLPSDYWWYPAIDTSADPGEEFASFDPLKALRDQRMLIASPRSVAVVIGRKEPKMTALYQKKKEEEAARQRAATAKRKKEAEKKKHELD